MGPRGQAGLFGRVLASRPALLEPVALAVHLQDMDMVGDAVEQRAGEALAGKDRGPFLEGQVRGDDGGAVLVAPAEDVEQELAAGLRQGDVSKLVDDQQPAYQVAVLVVVPMTKEKVGAPVTVTGWLKATANSMFSRAP